MGSVFMCQAITTSCPLLSGHFVHAHFAVACLRTMKMCTECHQYNGVHSGESLCHLTANFKVIVTIQHIFKVHTDGNLHGSKLIYLCFTQFKRVLNW
jgi:hypothetical protein